MPRHARPALVVAGLVVAALGLAGVVVAVLLAVHVAPDSGEALLAVALGGAGGALMPISGLLLGKGLPL